MKQNIENTIKQIERKRHIFFVISLTTYICLFYSIFKTDLTEWWKIFAVYFLIGCSEQIFNHRKFAHKSWDCPKWLDFLGLLLSNQSLIGNSIYFAAQHRPHHKFADTKFDPHSPLHISKFRIQFFFPYYNYSLKYASDLYNNKLIAFFSIYSLYILILSWIFLTYLFSLNWLLTIWFPGIALVILVKAYLNIIQHSEGFFNYKSYDLPDNSHNNIIWGYLAFDGWHQNHHKFPNSWYIGRKWWELDIPGLIILILSVFTLNFQNFKKL